MTIGILIFSSPKFEEHTGVDQLEEAAAKRGHNIVRLYEPYLSFLDSKIFHKDEPLPKMDVIISRPNFIEEPSLRTYAIQQLLHQGYRVINSQPSFTWAKNKLTQHVLFEQNDLPCPRWGIARKPQHALTIAKRIDFPVIVKTAFGTHGKGVFLATNEQMFQPIAEYLAIRDKNPLIIEEFIEEADNKDLRVFVVNGKVLAAMERSAAPGDIRANTSTGGSGKQVALSDEERDLAIRVTEVFGLEIAGVDIIRSKRGPLLLEINSNPGFKALQQVTDTDIAGCIIDFAANEAKKN